MYVTCLDMEGVLVPEIWIAFAEASGIPELKRTTRDEPDYDKLMNWRLGILRDCGQVIVISDTFTQFAKPLMEKLGMPTLFCNELVVAPDGEITGFKMRCDQSKLTTVKALQSCGFDTIAVGDSHNDLGMIRASKDGFLFRSTDAIIAENPDLQAFEEFDDLLAAIKGALEA